MKFEFDLEDATYELEQINNLLCIYKDFVNDECPEKEACGDDAKIAAQLFAIRTHLFYSLIDTAQDKIIAMRNSMETVIKEYHENKEKGGEVT